MDGETSQKKGSTLSGIFLITGTSIGAGMLGIPVVTGLAGFAPCMLVTTLCWLYMLATGLLFLEATLWMEDGANVLSMTKKFLGKWGWVLGGASFIFLYYCLLTAYFAAGAPLFTSAVENIFGVSMSPTGGAVLFTLTFFFIIFSGVYFTDRMNTVLMIVMITVYILIIALGVEHIDTELLTRKNWAMSFGAVPILFSAYGYHNIIPSISTYLKRNVRALRFSVIVGATIPFVIYSIWQWMLIGTIPQDFFFQAQEQGLPITEKMGDVMNDVWIVKIAHYFSFFALVTSVLGVSLSMVDFFGDGLKIKKRTGLRRLGLCALVFIPPFIFSCNNPRMFLKALHYAGIYGEAILNGLIPILMVWVGRYVMKKESQVKLPGGRFVLVILLCATIAIVLTEILGIFK
jgi:tyrosine-specific transport protein